MSVRDRFDRDTLNALQSIARSLERIADSMEKMEKIKVLILRSILDSSARSTM